MEKLGLVLSRKV